MSVIVAFLLASYAGVAELARNPQCHNVTNTPDEWGSCESDGYQIKVTWSAESSSFDCGFRYSLAYRRCSPPPSADTTDHLSYVYMLTYYNFMRRMSTEGTCNCPVPERSSRKIIDDEKCGIRKSNSNFRILGGQAVRPNSWKWVASLVHDGQHDAVHCGATLIAPKWVLTAAHCLHDGNGRPRMLKVILGDHRRLRSESTQVVRSYQQAFMPPGYELFTTNKDIALLKLDRPVYRSEYIDYACLPPRNATLISGDLCYITGWGRTTAKAQETPDELQEAEIPLVSWATCKRIPAYSFITKRQVCAGIRGSNPRDACAGDSGGGLFCKLPVDQLTEIYDDSNLNSEAQSGGRQRLSFRSGSNSKVSTKYSSTTRKGRSLTTLRSTPARKAGQNVTKNSTTKIAPTSRKVGKLNSTSTVSSTVGFKRNSFPRTTASLLPRSTTTTRRLSTVAITKARTLASTTARRTTKSTSPTTKKHTPTQSTVRTTTNYMTTQTPRQTKSSERVMDHRWFAFGVTSFGVGCGVNWGVYQRVSAFSEWIRSTIEAYD